MCWQTDRLLSRQCHNYTAVVDVQKVQMRVSLVQNLNGILVPTQVGTGTRFTSLAKIHKKVDIPAQKLGASFPPAARLCD